MGPKNICFPLVLIAFADFLTFFPLIFIAFFDFFAPQIFLKESDYVTNSNIDYDINKHFVNNIRGVSWRTANKIFTKKEKLAMRNGKKKRVNSQLAMDL